MSNLKGMEREAGNLRTCDVRVGNRLCPNYRKITGLMVGWQLEVEMAMADREEMPDEEKEATVWSLHVDYEHIHPFIDGNGRSGRLLMINHAILLGIEPWIVEYKDVQNYYNRF